jgi:hypothetical protein
MSMRSAWGVFAMAAARWAAPALVLALAPAAFGDAARSDPARGSRERAPWVRALEAAADRETTAEAHFRLGEIDEDEGAFARALDEDRACLAASPRGPWADRAAERIAWLEARDEGDFEPLARLERVRRDPSKSADPHEIEALAGDAEQFPPGRVRLEARLLVAEAWLGRLHRPEAAIPELRVVVSDSAADPVTARFAERELVDALVAVGLIAEARAEADRHRDRLEARFVTRVDRLARRVWLRAAAAAAVAVFLALAGASLLGASRRGRLGGARRPLRALAIPAAIFALDVGCVGALLAQREEGTSGRPFLLFAAAVLPLLLVARAWSAVGSNHLGARAGRAALCAATALAAAFLVLDASDPAFLEGFGL